MLVFNTWSKKTIIGQIPEPAEGQVVVVSPNQQYVYIFCGRGAHAFINTMHELNLQTMVCKQYTNSENGHYYAAGAILHDKLYVLGGYYSGGRFRTAKITVFNTRK